METLPHFLYDPPPCYSRLTGWPGKYFLPSTSQVLKSMSSGFGGHGPLVVRAGVVTQASASSTRAGAATEWSIAKSAVKRLW